MVEVNFSVATNRLLPKWAWSAVNEVWMNVKCLFLSIWAIQNDFQVAKGYSGCPESILVDLISSQSDDPSSSYMSKENLLARISHLLNRCSHIEKLMINFEMKYDEAEFEVIKGTMKTISVDHFELVGFTPSAESVQLFLWNCILSISSSILFLCRSKILSLIKEHPVKSLTIEMFTPDRTRFSTFWFMQTLLCKGSDLMWYFFRIIFRRSCAADTCVHPCQYLVRTMVLERTRAYAELRSESSASEDGVSEG